MKPRNHPNVVEAVRTHANLTQRELASRANLSTIYVLRAEQSLLPGLSDALANALSEIARDFNVTYDDLINITPDEIQLCYATERRHKIVMFSHDLTESDDYVATVRTALDYAVDHYVPTYAVPGDTNSQTCSKSELRMRHPFYLTRTYLFSKYGLPTSQIKFASLTGAHTATLSALERGKITLSDAPALIDILRKVLKFTDDQINLLEKMCLECL